MGPETFGPSVGVQGHGGPAANAERCRGRQQSQLRRVAQSSPLPRRLRIGKCRVIAQHRSGEERDELTTPGLVNRRIVAGNETRSSGVQISATCIRPSVRASSSKENQLRAAGVRSRSLEASA
jgi:hypothetical protein